MDGLDRSTERRQARTVGTLQRARQALRSIAVLAAGSLLVASCSSAGPSIPGAPSGGPTATGSPSAGAAATASSTPAPTATPEPTPAPSATPTASAAPSLDARGCPVASVDLATVRDVAKAGRALTCFGSRSLTFAAYVPAIEGLGGVSAFRMTPRWLADPWTGVIVQPEPLADVDQDAWLVVRVRPALGACGITDVTAAACPFGALLEHRVTVTGHFDDPAAQTCRSHAFEMGGDPGPSKKQMIARCRAAFVVTAVAPAS